MRAGCRQLTRAQAHRLQGLLPDVVESIELQAERVMFQLHHEADTGLQARTKTHPSLFPPYIRHCLQTNPCERCPHTVNMSPTV